MINTNDEKLIASLLNCLFNGTPVIINRTPVRKERVIDKNCNEKETTDEIDSVINLVNSINKAYKDSVKSGRNRTVNNLGVPAIDRVLFQDTATVVFWKDGTKTVVKTQNDETFDKEKGLAMAFVKKACGNTRDYYEMFLKYCK